MLLPSSRLILSNSFRSGILEAKGQQAGLVSPAPHSAIPAPYPGSQQAMLAKSTRPVFPIRRLIRAQGNLRALLRCENRIRIDRTGGNPKTLDSGFSVLEAQISMSTDSKTPKICPFALGMFLFTSLLVSGGHVSRKPRFKACSECLSLTPVAVGSLP